MLSANLNTPYPPPDLLHPMAEKIQILSNNSGQTQPEKPEAAPSATPTTPAAATAPPAPAPSK
jgi:hypothetical protein